MSRVTESCACGAELTLDMPSVGATLAEIDRYNAAVRSFRTHHSRCLQSWAIQLEARTSRGGRR